MMDTDDEVKSRGIERLRTLYAVISGIPKDRIDLEEWRTGGVGDKQLLKSCGTMACAVGWACAYPEFKRQGLKYRDYGPETEYLVGWSAVQNFFGLSPAEAFAIFHAREEEWLKDASLIYGADELKILRDIRGNERGLSDKKRVLKRIRRHLLNNGAISKKRNFELATQEATVR